MLSVCIQLDYKVDKQVAKVYYKAEAKCITFVSSHFYGLPK